PGDRVERDEPLFEISTDKVDTEIPSPAAGTLAEILVPEGQTVGINTVVARIGDGDGAPAEKPAAAAPPKAEAAPPASAPPKAEAAPPTSAPPKAEAAPPAPPEQAPPAEESAEPTGKLSPLVRKMARENNIDTSRVKGSGAGGRITKQDMEAYLASGAQPPAAPAPAPAAPTAPPAMAPLAPAGQAKTRIEPMSTMRIKIAEHMVMSKQTSAHVTTVHRVDMTKVAKMRERHKAQFQAAYGFGLTYLPFITRAAVAGLRQYP